MDKDFYKEHTSAFFAGKEAKIISAFKTYGGAEFKLNLRVIIKGKHARGGFVLVEKGNEKNYVTRVQPYRIELVTD